MKRGIYAGSFDPTTRGHLDVIRRASLIVDELHVMIGVNPKKIGGLFLSPSASN
jgi:pantetheine-phosphate adenylyltransferase